MDKTFIGWLLALGIGFPLLGMLLGELAQILRRQKHPLFNTVRKIRRYLLPSLAVLFIMRELLKISQIEGSVRLVETITWIALILVVISLINAILTTSQPEKKFQIQVPNFFFQVTRAIIVLGIGYYLVTRVWGFDTSELTTAAGVGSLVVALALQDTLSSLVSGLLLLVAKPFKVGDWIDFDGSQARVIDRDWWSVTVQTPVFERTIPNSALSKASITNYGQGKIGKKIDVSFSYDDPPDRVIAALQRLPDGIAEVEEGTSMSYVDSYGDSSVNYKLLYKVIPEEALMVTNTLKRRAYYMAKREGFTIPYPIGVEYNIDFKDGLPDRIPQVSQNRQSEKIAFLRSLSCFFAASDLQIKQLANKSQFEMYGEGEQIVREGIPDRGLYAIYKGRVKSSITDNEGLMQTDKELGVGNIFGEMTIFPEETSPVTVIAEDNVEVIVIPDEEVVRLIEANSRFGLEMVRFIEERKKAMALLIGNILEENRNNLEFEIVKHESNGRTQYR